MGLRENLREALPDDRFNADLLMARARFGGERPRAWRQWAAIAGAALLASAAIATLVTIRFAHTTRPAQPAHVPAATPGSRQPPATLDTSFAGLLNYQVPAPDSGWLQLFTPSGTNVVYHTVDGGNRWEEQLRVNGLGFGARLQAIDRRQAVLVANANIASTTPGPIRVYATANAGANWQKADGPHAALQASFFLSTSEGWITTAATAPTRAGGGYTLDTSRITLYHTSDGGAHWEKVDGADGLTGDDNKGSLYFLDGKSGWLASYDRHTGRTSRIYSTRDGGHSWRAQEFPGATRVSVPRFFGSAAGVLVTDTGVYRSHDGGVSWTKALAGSGQVYFADADHWFRIQGRGLEASSDRGLTWSEPRPWKLPLPAGWSQSTLAFVSPSLVLLAISDGGNGWISIGGGGPVGESYNQTIGRSVPHYAVLRSTDGGANWEPVRLPVP
jgi:photosystem II stability/assembly factor-like uncharacterized protein